MAIEYAGSGNDDGDVMGRSSGLIGFYGLGTAIAVQTVTLSNGESTTGLKADVLAIVTALTALGMITAG